MTEIIKKRMALKTKEQKGFTLIEVIVVLVILAILMAIAIPALTGYIDKAGDRALIAEAAQARTAVQAGATDTYGNTGSVADATNPAKYKFVGTAPTGTATWEDVVHDLTGADVTNITITATADATHWNGTTLKQLEFAKSGKLVTWTPNAGYVVTTPTP